MNFREHIKLGRLAIMRARRREMAARCPDCGQVHGNDGQDPRAALLATLLRARVVEVDDDQAPPDKTPLN